MMVSSPCMTTGHVVDFHRHWRACGVRERIFLGIIPPLIISLDSSTIVLIVLQMKERGSAGRLIAAVFVLILPFTQLTIGCMLFLLRHVCAYSTYGTGMETLVRIYKVDTPTNWH